MEKRELRGDLIKVYKYLTDRCHENRLRLFSVKPGDSRKGNRHKLKHRTFHLNVREPVESP